LNIEIDGNNYEYEKDSNETILNFLKRKKETMAFQCQDGYCGVCRCQKIEGEVEEIKDALGFKDYDEILPCISIPKSSIKISKNKSKI
jgi:ferredoxin